MLATAAILTALVGKLVAVNKFGVHGAALLVLLIALDIAVVIVSHNGGTH